jgi:four helix bundle protein
MKIKTLRELKIWQLAKRFVDAVSAILERQAFRRDRKLRDQLNESSLSILSNVAEGFGQRTDRAFANHVGIARGSNNEAISQLAVACTRGYITEQEYAQLEDLSDQMGRMMTSLIAHLDKEDRKLRG